MEPGVVFVCIGNSCRSIMAEALTRHVWGQSYRAASAGTYPLGVITPLTLEVLHERQVPTEGLYSKGLEDLDLSRFQLLVNLSGTHLAMGITDPFPGLIVPWFVHDPYGEGLSSFRKVRNTIEALVRERLPAWMSRALS